MLERERLLPALAQVGFILCVLCVGVAGGAFLVTVSPSRSPLPPPAAAPSASPPRAASTAVREPVAMEADGRGVPAVADDAEWFDSSLQTGSSYRPVSSGGMAGEVFVMSDSLVVDRLASLPEVSRPPSSEVVGHDSSISRPVSPDPEETRSAPASSYVDDVGVMDRERAAGAMLFAVASGGQATFFDVGVPGARELPPSIRGRWAWIGTCTEAKVEISQLPGGAVGGVRGVGTSALREQMGWVAPRAGCRSASRSVAPPTVNDPPPADAPTGVRELRALGGVPCDEGVTCQWFVGVDGRGDAVAMLIRGRRDRWQRLRPGGHR